jgi:hypothetical protein
MLQNAHAYDLWVNNTIIREINGVVSIVEKMVESHLSLFGH